FIKICANTFQEVKKHQLTADVSRLGCICAALFIHSVFGSPRPAAALSRFYLKLCFQMADYQFE
ncbi:hypothetical protein, partial [Bacillus licheniformis]|uniref:hypothetical protein n=1 Tax=Bacillus licheniformis TaxID=1402 RepID=UPI001E3A9579